MAQVLGHHPRGYPTCVGPRFPAPEALVIDSCLLSRHLGVRRGRCGPCAHRASSPAGKKRNQLYKVSTKDNKS